MCTIRSHTFCSGDGVDSHFSLVKTEITRENVCYAAKVKICRTGNGMIWGGGGGGGGGGGEMQAMSYVDLSGLSHIQITLKVDDNARASTRQMVMVLSRL